MNCLQQTDDMVLWGNYDTDIASNLMIVFETCDVNKLPPGQKCKSEKEIEKWMEFKYIIVLENEAKFI